MKNLDVLATQNFVFEGSTYPESFVEKWKNAVQFLRSTKIGWLLDKGVEKQVR